MISTLIEFAKTVARKFYGCKRFNSLLPLTHERKEQAMPFQVKVTDFVGPTYYRAKIKAESKVYNLLFSCSRSLKTRVFKMFKTINRTQMET